MQCRFYGIADSRFLVFQYRKLKEAYILASFKQRVQANPKRIVFPEGDDIRVVRAVKELVNENLIREAILIGRKEIIISNARAEGLAEHSFRVIEADVFAKEVRYRNEYKKARAMSILEDDLIAEALADPIVGGALLLRFDEADCLIAGLKNTTARVLSTGINIIKANRQFGVVTSFLLIFSDNPQLGENGVILVADPVVNPDPSVGVLCKIAEAAAYFMENFLGIKGKIAFLSYSTKGSGKGKSVDKMRIAAERTAVKLKNCVVDGELQLDAAISPSIARIKAPESPLKGMANILIFPNLDAANIGSKLVQFFGKAKLVGPIIFGLNKPFNDISRGADEMDLVNLSIISQLQCP
ncbi:MAG: phosphate acyltransferase [Spirochaetes bacterium]|nr:phosphate acyltransferase [Spirochaetota bacterium]